MRRLSLYSTVTAFLCAASVVSYSRESAYEASGDVSTSGLYSVQGCGSNASSIAAILDSMPPSLEPAITDTHSTRTSPAYNTFFKDIAHAPFVRRILQNIARGTPVLPGLAQPGFSKVTSPVIACISSSRLSNPSPDLVGLTPWVQAFAKEDCNRYRGGSATYGIYVGGTNIVVLCPFWFSSDTPVEPKSKRPCIAVDRTVNQFRGLGYPLARNRRAWLLHELVHVYLVAATNTREPVHEVYTVNDCFALNAYAQRYMPNNYVYYAGSMSLSLHSQCSPAQTSPTFEPAIKTNLVFVCCRANITNQDVLYKCTSFPAVSFRDRELSTSVSNTTAGTVRANSTLSKAELP